ncbi:MAG TPA: hypothetical protein PK228_06905 [Saprospiraceae bacterium]|nr:hypothetical protein [Saprospiraceae bacterium]
MVAQQGYDEIATLLADMDPAKLVSLKASSILQERVEDLLEKSKEEGLNEEEKVEMEHYLIINRLFTMAKIKARRKLNALLANETENLR